MKKIIIDTDIGPDCDDVGALAVANKLANEGKCEILGVAHCTSDRFGAYAIKAVNDAFGRRNVPVAQSERHGFYEDEGSRKYSRALAFEYQQKYGEEQFENPVKMYRRLLAENRDVTVITIGFFNNIAELLASGPDEISNLTGEELVKRSVSRIYSMAGNFNDSNHGECNVVGDLTSTVTVVNGKTVPMTFLGFEVGIQVKCGGSLKDAPGDYVVKKAYGLYKMHSLTGEFTDYTRDGWDPLTVYYAVTEDKSFMHEVGANIKIGAAGGVFYDVDEKSDSSYIVMDDAARALEVMDRLLAF